MDGGWDLEVYIELSLVARVTGPCVIKYDDSDCVCGGQGQGRRASNKKKEQQQIQIHEELSLPYLGLVCFPWVCHHTVLLPICSPIHAYADADAAAAFFGAAAAGAAPAVVVAPASSAASTRHWGLSGLRISRSPPFCTPFQ